MAPASRGSRIIRTYVVTSAPTGEGMRYVCEDGTTWKDCPAPGQQVTGQTFGVREGDVIRVARPWR